VCVASEATAGYPVYNTVVSQLVRRKLLSSIGTYP
jgi:hypothetical protein